MARKLTIKQENFAMAYVETGNASEAYRQAYNGENMQPKTIKKRAAELLKNGAITGAIERLQESARRRHDITVDGLTWELECARQAALENRNFSAAVAATTGKAKLHGLWDNKKNSEKQVNVAIIVPEKQTAEEWVQQHRK